MRGSNSQRILMPEIRSALLRFIRQFLKNEEIEIRKLTFVDNLPRGSWKLLVIFFIFSSIFFSFLTIRNKQFERTLKDLSSWRYWLSYFALDSVQIFLISGDTDASRPHIAPILVFIFIPKADLCLSANRARFTRFYETSRCLPFALVYIDLNIFVVKARFRGVRGWKKWKESFNILWR